MTNSRVSDIIGLTEEVITFLNNFYEGESPWLFSIISRIQQDSIENDIMSGYTQIGKKYVDYVKKTSEMPGIDVSDVLKMLDPKFERRDELQAKMIEIEKRRKDRTLLQEKSAVEAQVQAEIEKLDKALAMELIGQAEYDTKVAQLKKRVDNFEAIKRVEQKCQMGIITAAERDKEIEALLM